MSGSAYARLVPKLHRSRRSLPRINRPIRPRMIAWAGPAAFYPNRFYEQDKWYKARIDKPEQIPKMHIIDPVNHMHSLADIMKKEAPTAINIGFKSQPPTLVQKSDEERAVLEKKARKLELMVDFDAIPGTPSLNIYHHYNIYDHLFGEGVYFENVQDLDVSFEDHGVYTGNVIDVANFKENPKVSIQSVGEGLNTLLFVNLDGSPKGDGELLQWMVANIPDGKSISSGEQILEYLQPLPFYGTGYHRVAFLLFRHKEKLNVSPMDSSLEARIFSVAKFYKTHEDIITPSCVTFSQTSYGETVKEKLHSMGLPNPLFEYEYTEALKPEQKEFPIKPQPFDLYLDMYRDPKEVEAELLEERLKRAQLDDYQAPKWLDPNYNENKKTLPAWQHRRILARNGRFQALYSNSVQS